MMPHCFTVSNTISSRFRRKWLLSNLLPPLSCADGLCSNFHSLTERCSRHHPATGWHGHASSRRWQHQNVGSLSQRDWVQLEDRLLKNVGESVYDPILHRSLASLQWLGRKIGRKQQHETSGSTTTTQLQVLLQPPSRLHPHLAQLQQNVRDAVLRELHRTEFDNDHVAIDVTVLPQPSLPYMARLVDNPDELLHQLGPGLHQVTHFVAVYSCKGGVGKSTVAVNLAYELAAMGGRVGLLDVDVYGPSLPLLVTPDDLSIRPSSLHGDSGAGMVQPIEHGGVKLLSLGWVNRQSGVPGSGAHNGASIMRGPLAHKVVAQLLKHTDWGELDVLVLDLPPGTGDVQLAMLQDVQLSGAVAVTTPSKLAIVDTRKGIDMFTSLGVPTLAIVQNMSYFECEHGSIHHPFGRGLRHDDRLGASADADIVDLPISSWTNDNSDLTDPITLVRPATASKELASFGLLANSVARQLLKIQYGYSENPQMVVFEGERDDVFDLSKLRLTLDKTAQHDESFGVRLFSEAGALQKTVRPADLRSRDPKNGDITPDSPHRNSAETVRSSLGPVQVTRSNEQHSPSGKRSPAIIPVRVDRRGRYGFGVEWGDGATIIYSLLCIARAAGARPVGEL